MPLTRQHTAVVEILKDVVHRKQSALVNQNLREKTIALDLARQAALFTFAIGGDSWPYDEDALWYEERPYVRTRDPAITRKMALRCGKSLKGEELFESFLGSLFQSRISYHGVAPFLLAGSLYARGRTPAP